MKQSQIVRRTIAGLAALCVVAATRAQLVPLVSPPSAPTNLTPAAGDYQGYPGGATPLVMGWNELIQSPGVLYLYPPATHFIVCIDVVSGTSAPPCTLASADYLESIAAPTAALTRVGSRFTFMPGRVLANSELNQPLRLSVGACSALVDRSCRVVGVNLFYGTRNLHTPTATVNQSRNNATTWVFDIKASNGGTDAIGPFDGAVKVYEVLWRGTLGRTCRTDVDAPDVIADMTLTAIDENGTMTPVPELNRPGGSYSGPLIRGMYRAPSLADTFTFSDMSNPSILGNGSGTAVGIVTIPIAAPPDGAPQRTFVLVARLDTANAVREFNENDNVRAYCKTR